MERLQWLRRGYEIMHYKVGRRAGMLVYPGTKHRTLEEMNTALQASVCIFYVFIGIYNMYNHSSNFTILFELSFFTAVLVSVFFCGYNYWFYSKNLYTIMELVGKNFYEYEGEVGPRDPAAQRVATTFSQVYAVVVFSTGVGFMLVVPITNLFIPPQPDPEVDRRLPIAMSFPFSTSTIYGFIFGIFLQALGDFCICMWTIPSDSLAIQAMIQLKYQLSSLRTSMETMKERATLRCPEAPDYWRAFRENIKHHQVIVRVLRITQKTYENIFTIMILNSSVLIAACGYLALQIPDPAVKIKAVQGILTSVFHPFFYCLAGQKLTDENDRLFFCLYDLEWYSKDAKFKKSLRIMMTYVSKPVVMKSFFFVSPLNMKVFNDIISSSYSYINLLRQV